MLAPYPSSSIEVRREAWLTAIQETHMTPNNFVFEAVTLCWKIFKLRLRNLIGPLFYVDLTRLTNDKEVARVKAWTIAIDAQLAGGDVFVNKKRLWLTLLASNTLPDTPMRLMLKALHIRVLLLEFGNIGLNKWYIFQDLATTISRWKWNKARLLQQPHAHKKGHQEDELPSHLLTLLEQECDDVLVDSISQRASNLAWNLPVVHKFGDAKNCMRDTIDDFIFTDTAIRSPLDAVASWYSSRILQQALTESLKSEENSSVSVSDQKFIGDSINLATSISPIGSRAQIRALVARAVLVEEKRGNSIAEVLRTIDPLEEKMAGRNKVAIPSSITKITALAGLPDTQMSLLCAKAIARLQYFTPPSTPQTAH